MIKKFRDSNLALFERRLTHLHYLVERPTGNVFADITCVFDTLQTDLQVLQVCNESSV